MLAYIPFSLDSPINLLTSTLPMAIINSSKQILDTLCTDDTYIVSSAMTPVNSRKRTSKEAESSSTSSTISAACKKPCLSPVGARTNTPMRLDSHLDLLTPPETPPFPAVRTMRLKLEIPQREVSKEEDGKLKIQRAAAERWVPKLKRPFPRKREIKAAYKNKLMRHYTNETVALSDFVKPHIDRSPRVDSLRKGFPLLSTSSASIANADGSKKRRVKIQADREEALRRAQLLKENKKITHSDFAKRLAWQAFSSREQDRIDRGREAMLQSGLLRDDLVKENFGVANELPEWRKTKTGRFAKSARKAMSQAAAKGSGSSC